MVFDSKAFFGHAVLQHLHRSRAHHLGDHLGRDGAGDAAWVSAERWRPCRASRALRWLVQAYLGFFRGVPVLVQIVFWYNALPVLTNNAINLPALVAGTMALALNEGAYMTEIIRSGLLSVDPGQREAARALGMTKAKALRRIVLPQALAVIIPPTGNQFIAMLKTTSLLFAIAVPEIFSTGTNIYSQNFNYFEVLLVVSIWYLVLTALLTVFQKIIERRFASPANRAGPERCPPWSMADGAGRDHRRPQALRQTRSPARCLAEVDAGEVVCLLGASGSGKTTLLRCINHLETIDRGEIKVAGELVGYTRGGDGRLREEKDQNPSAKRARIGMVFQRFNLFAHLTVVENMTKRRCRC